MNVNFPETSSRSTPFGVAGAVLLTSGAYTWYKGNSKLGIYQMALGTFSMMMFACLSYNESQTIAAINEFRNEDSSARWVKREINTCNSPKSNCSPTYKSMYDVLNSCLGLRDNQSENEYKSCVNNAAKIAYPSAIVDITHHCLENEKNQKLFNCVWNNKNIWRIKDNNFPDYRAANALELITVYTNMFNTTS